MESPAESEVEEPRDPSLTRDGASVDDEERLPASALGPLDAYCELVANAVDDPTADGQVRILIDRLRARRIYGRILFHRPGRPSTPAAAELTALRRLLFVESAHEDEWQNLVGSHAGGWWAADMVGRLGRLAIAELKPRLPQRGASRGRFDRALSDAARHAGEALSRVPADDDELPAAVAVRHEACRVVWLQFLTATFFWPEPLFDAESRGKYLATRLSPASLDALRAIGVTDKKEQWRLCDRMGAMFEGAVFIDLSERPRESLLAVARATSMTHDSSTLSPDPTRPRDDGGLETAAEQLEARLEDEARWDREEVVNRGRKRQVTRERAGLVALANAVQADVETRNARYGRLLLAIDPDPAERDRKLLEIGEDPRKVPPALSRARTLRRRFLVARGVLRGRVVGVGERLGSRHVLPPCLDTCLPELRDLVSMLRDHEATLAAAMRKLPADHAAAVELLDPLLRAAHAARGELRVALPKTRAHALYEKGLVVEPPGMPPALWRVEAQGLPGDGPDAVGYAAQSGRVVVAPCTPDHVWRIDSAIVATVAGPSGDYLRGMFDDIAAGEWYLFLKGGIDV